MRCILMRVHTIIIRTISVKEYIKVMRIEQPSAPLWMMDTRLVISVRNNAPALGRGEGRQPRGGSAPFSPPCPPFLLSILDKHHITIRI